MIRLLDIAKNNPLVIYSARKGSTTNLTYNVDPNYKPEPEFRHGVNPDVINIAAMPAKTTETAVAPIRGQFAFFPDPTVDFPIQDFAVPVEFFLVIHADRNIPAEQPAPPPAPVPAHCSNWKTCAAVPKHQFQTKCLKWGMLWMLCSCSQPSLLQSGLQTIH